MAVLKRSIPTRLAALFAGIALVSGASAQHPFNDLMFPEQAATFAGPNDAVMWFVFWVSAFFFVLLMGLMVYFSVKYRRRPGVPQQRSVSHNTPLELLWSGIPLILVGVMFVWGLFIYTDMMVAPGRAETVSVTARKWSWTWDYDNGGQSLETTKDFKVIAEAPVFAVPVGRPMKLLMHSEDVIHSLFIPVFRKKIDVHPNRYTTYWFQADTPGDYELYCAEYCGDQHSQMMARVRALPEAEYQEWKAKLLDTSKVPLLELGRKLYITKGCNACHSLDGAPGTGPSWQGVYMKPHAMTDGTTLTADENYLRESILVPGSHIVAGFSNQMPVYMGKLTDRELLALITLIKSLSESGQSEVEAIMKQDEADRAALEAGAASN